ncbi:hypothetical protein GIB67_041131 [Kingdonia uniflora]|uniref:Cytochrome P450 n=1 Tax=Kingdonia uniflora TaxID=39325 RepID=A0A7J7LKA6_9MAGN|nr:hypothetical protein GIB67_041131 [Kingdonia uniflora]
MKFDIFKMSVFLVGLITLVFLLFISRIFRRDSKGKNIPCGSLGFPVIGESLSFLNAQKENRGEDWINERILKHGPVFKTSLMGTPTVVITGQAGNKFVLGSDNDVFILTQPMTVVKVAGKYSLFQLIGPRYKFVKGAMVSFLKPESLQRYVGHLDKMVKAQVLREFKDTETIKAVDFTKKLTFDVTFTVLYGLLDDSLKEVMLHDFNLALKALWSVPLNFPGTIFHQGLQARSRIIKRILPILQKRKQALLEGTLNPRNDVLTWMLSVREENQEPISLDEIIDNFIGLTIASHDTTSIVLSLMIRKFARDPKISEKVREEQMDILTNRGESLTWSELQKMKYTWRVAQEIMRMIPPVFGSFRKAVKDLNFGDYFIPKGWQVFWISHGTHMNDEIFENPKEFNPSRFDNPSKPISPFTYIPFGGGPHMCIGNEFARVEILTIIHHLKTHQTQSQKMSIFLVSFITLVFLLFIFRIFRRDFKGKNLPSGSLGFPVVGESLSFINAQKANRGEDWINEKILKHGPVFKTSLMGAPTVVITGQAGNKFVLGSDSDVLTVTQPMTIVRITGKYNILELIEPRYKLVKGAMVSFLKPESLQRYVGHLDKMVKAQVLREFKDKETIKAVDFIKKLTFDVTFTVLYGLFDDSLKEVMLHDFNIALRALWSIPLNFPGTIFHQGLQARSRIVKRLLPILQKRKQALLEGTLNPRNDVLTWMLSVREENQEPISLDEITDSFIGLTIASHDTTSIVLSLMIRKFARDPKISEKVREEQMDILINREGENLTWSELQKMKYTWRVAQEMMRMIPPVFGTFRKAVKDLNFGGYFIPKGWQVFWVSHGTHMNDEIFENPKEFNPSRFDNPSKPISPFTYVPFGGGPRMCIGNEFARVEILTIIHHLVTKFEWSQMIPDEPITRQPMPYPSMGLPIRIKPLNRS